MRHDSDPLAAAPKSFNKPGVGVEDVHKNKNNAPEPAKEANTSHDAKKDPPYAPPAKLQPAPKLDLKGNTVAKVGSSVLDPSLLAQVLPKGGANMELEKGTALGSVAASTTSTVLNESPAAALRANSHKQRPAVKPKSLVKAGSNPNHQKEAAMAEMDAKEDDGAGGNKNIDKRESKEKKHRSADNKDGSKERIKSPATGACEPRKKVSKTKSNEHRTKSGTKVNHDKHHHSASRTKSKGKVKSAGGHKCHHHHKTKSKTGGNAKERVTTKAGRTKSTSSHLKNHKTKGNPPKAGGSHTKVKRDTSHEKQATGKSGGGKGKPKSADKQTNG